MASCIDTSKTCASSRPRLNITFRQGRGIATYTKGKKARMASEAGKRKPQLGSFVVLGHSQSGRQLAECMHDRRTERIRQFRARFPPRESTRTAGTAPRACTTSTDRGAIRTMRMFPNGVGQYLQKDPTAFTHVNLCSPCKKQSQRRRVDKLEDCNLSSRRLFCWSNRTSPCCTLLPLSGIFVAHHDYHILRHGYDACRLYKVFYSTI